MADHQGKSGDGTSHIDESAWNKLLFGVETADLQPMLPGTSFRRVRIPTPEPVQQPYIEQAGTEYAAAYQNESDQQALATAEMSESLQRFRLQQLLEANKSAAISIINWPAELRKKIAVYSQYDFNSPIGRKPLAIDSKRFDILNLLKTENVIVIQGFTGCGKSTQVPQFILDECASSNTPCNIVVTQPRRIAAISIAKRVSSERNWNLGTVVGFQVGMQKQSSELTVLTYLTTGCLLEILVARKSLEGYTHIILDEVHERDQDTDLLLMVVRKFQRAIHSSNVKVILMSATANADKFAKYFETPFQGVFRNAEIIKVPETKNSHPVSVYYFDHLMDIPYLKEYVPRNPQTSEGKEPKIDPMCYNTAVHIIAALDGKREICRYGRNSDYQSISSVRGAVLVFLPGVAEISEMEKALIAFENGAAAGKKNYWRILPLHSRITGEEQNRVFQPVEGHFRKIILSTNIAESSLTVPDIIYVIDFCLTRQLQVDSLTNFCSLKTEWASKNSCVQRQGRVGRVNEGVVYRMLWQSFYKHHLPEDVIPEMLRCPLESAILRTKWLNLGPPKALLGLVMDTPNLDSIVRTIATLKEVGALFTTANDIFTAEDGDLSYLGRVISKLPIDVHLGKLIMLGYVFNILEDCVIMAAGMSLNKNIFINSNSCKLSAYHSKLSFAEGSFSDSIVILNAFKKWKTLPRDRERPWARENYINLKALKDMDELIKELQYRLSSMGITSGRNIQPLSDSQKDLLHFTVLFGAFYPNYFSRKAFEDDEREAVRALCGADPYSTILLKKFPNDVPPKAFLTQIKRNLKEIERIDDCWDVKINFDSQRVFITFHQEGSSSKIGRISLPVYLALKQAQLRHSYSIQLIKNDIAERYSRMIEDSAKKLLLSGGPSRSYSFLMPPKRLMFESTELLSVCHAEDPSKFWCQRLDKESKQDYHHINSLIEGLCDPCPYPIKGELVMAPFGAQYFRAKILSAILQHQEKIRVYFIDYGNTAEVFLQDLRVMPSALLHIKPLVIECRMAGIGPSLFIDLKGAWSPTAKEWFQTKTVDIRLQARVFSVVDGIASVDLIQEDGGNWNNSIANQMIDLNYAVKVEESCLSKDDNEERSKPLKIYNQLKIKKFEKERIAAAELMVAQSQVSEPSQRDFGKRIDLSGPSNPLEMKLLGKVNALSSFKIHIEDDSVNSILLDDHPEDFHHERFMIAAQIITKRDSKIVVARSTTLMPNLPGLVSILTLLFSPRAEFRADKSRNRLTGAICGLGYDELRNHQSFYPEHDMEINFDTEIHLKDVFMINKMRYWMNSILGAKSYINSDFSATTSGSVREDGLIRLNRLLFELIKTRRDVEAVHTTHGRWNQVKPDYLLEIDDPNNQRECLFPQHNCIKLVPI